MRTVGSYNVSQEETVSVHVSGADLRRACDRLVAQSLSPICFSLAGVYALVAVSHTFALFEPQSLLLGSVAFGTIIFLLALPYVIHRWPIPQEWSHVCGASIVAVVVGNVLLRFFVLQNTRYTIDIVLCVIGTGGLFLSARWLLGTLFAIVTSWVVAAAVLFPTILWSHEALVIVAASVLAILIHLVRRRNVQELEWLRQQERGQRTALEATLTQLHQSEAHYRSLVDNANDGIVSFTLDGTLTSVNRGLAEMLGWSVQEMMGHTYREFATPEFWRQGEERTRKVLAGERVPSSFTGELRRRDGSLVPVEARARLIRDAAGHVVGVQGIFRDITERMKVEEHLRLYNEQIQRHAEELEQRVAERTVALMDANASLQEEISERMRIQAIVRESEERYRSLFEACPEAILVHHDGRVVLANPACARLAGFPDADALIGKSIWDFIPAEVSGVTRERLHALIEEQRPAEPIEIKLRRLTGELLDVESSAIFFLYRGKPAALGFLRDITTRKRAEEGLRELNAQLEQRVKTRTAQLQIAKEQAEAADRLKSAFLATMSHELRTPLNSIIGFTGVILQGLAGPLNSEQSKQLDMVRTSARHLLSLINDVLDISKIEAGQIEIHAKSFAYPEAIEKVVKTVSVLAEQKGLALQTAVAANINLIESDRRRVEQILLNLLNNAIKFTETGTVRLECRRIPGWIETSVSDTGIGIRNDDRHKLFQTFRQLDTGLTRRHEGTGLGLAICKRLVELLGGTIWVDSVWGMGSTFTFTLPITEPTENLQPYVAHHLSH